MSLDSAQLETHMNVDTAPPPVSEQRVDSDIFGTFFVGENEFAVSVDAIQEVVNEPAEFTSLPLSPDYLTGLFNLRGVVIPVVDLRAIFGLAETEQTDGVRKVAIIEHGDHCFGLLIDRTGDVFNAKEAERSVFSRVSGDIRETIIGGVFKLEAGARLVQILDPYELLKLDRLPRVTGALRSALSRHKRGKRKQCISFIVGDSICAFDMTSIKEIVELQTIDNTSLAHDWTLGAIDLRGNTVPVIDFRVFLGKSCTASVEELVARGSKLIVMKLGENLISLLVDGIDNIISFYDDDLLAFPNVGLYRGEMFKGCLATEDDGMVLLLDHACLLDDDQLERVTRGHSALFHAKDEATRSHTRSKKSKRTLITFQIGASYGLDIETVSEVIGFPDEIMQPPSLPGYLEGMVNIRGELIPVINLRILYDLEPIDRERTKLLIFRHASKKYAIMVDSVESIINITDQNSHLLPPLNSDAPEKAISNDVKEAILIEGEGEDQKSLMVLDLDAVVARTNI